MGNLKMIKPKIGLALGGGGARGLAHIGVLKVFEREGIQIDQLSGSSMGGLLGAAYSAGLSPADLETEAVWISHLRNLIRVLDLRPGRRGLFEGKLLRSFLIDHLNLDTTFDKLHIPLALTAVDIRTSEAILLKEGSVIDAVMATSAFPGLLPPVKLEERFLIDGGTLDNVPADAVRELGAEIVIAVNVVPTSRLDMTLDDSEFRDNWLKLIPGSLLDLYQAAMIAISELSEIKLQKAKPDLVITPTMPKDLLVFTGFFRAAEAIEAGEKATEEMLPKIEQLIENSS
jgi:NTE family protein